MKSFQTRIQLFQWRVANARINCVIGFGGGTTHVIERLRPPRNRGSVTLCREGTMTGANYYIEHLIVLVERAKAEQLTELRFFLEMALEQARQSQRVKRPSKKAA